MSGEDDFLRRWSRRKREAAEARNPAPPATETEDVTSPECDTSSETPCVGAQAEFDLATLPPIESINALSDVTAFLRAGVPAELLRAALRRVWTADPSIRDFVGLAENSWDFTDPGAMPGFGPLEMTDDVRRMIAQVVDQIGQTSNPVSPNDTADRRHEDQNSNNSNAITADQRGKDALETSAPIDETQQNAVQNLGDQALLHGNINNTASQHDVTETQEKPKQLSYRSHGSALPR